MSDQKKRPTGVSGNKAWSSAEVNCQMKSAAINQCNERETSP